MKGRLRICRGWCTCFDHGSPSDFRVIINPLFPCHVGQIPHMKELNLYSLMSLWITQDPGPVWVSEIWDTRHFSFLYHTLSPNLLNSAQPGLYFLSKTNKAEGFSWRPIIILGLSGMHCCSVTKSYPSLWDPMDCNLPGCSRLWGFSRQ